MFTGITMMTLNNLSTLTKIEDNPDLTDDFFGMLCRYVKFKPKIILLC